MYKTSDKSHKLQARLEAFMEKHVYPNEDAHKYQLLAATKRFPPLRLVEELEARARQAGLWNLFVPEEHAQYCDHGGLGFTDYAPLAETMVRVLWDPAMPELDKRQRAAHYDDLQGVKKRTLAGNASSEKGLQMGEYVAPLAAMAVELMTP